MKVLLAGNTGYVTEEFVEEAFPECQVMVLGNKMLKTARRRELISRPFPRTELELGDIFRTYEFEAVVYFSNYLTLHGELEGEAENLRKILQYCRKGVQSHFLYVTGPEGMYDVPTGKTLLVQNAEDVCRRYAGLYGLTVKILRVPYLYSGTYKKDFFYRIFQASKESQKLFFQEAPEQKACFLYSMDLAELVYKLFDNWNDEEEVLNVPDVFDICFQDVTEELKKVLSPVSIIYKSSAVVEKIKEDDRQIRTNYNWFPKISVLDQISEMYKEYKKNNGEKASWFTRLFNQNQRWLRVCEFVVCFLAFEFLQRLLGNQAQFKMIDLRLVFIVLFGSLYGLGYGIAGAAAQAVSLLLAYESQGTKWYTLFYEPANWIPFIFYFAVGAICGYVRMKNKENIEFVTDENKLIQEKFLFMRDMYQDSLYDKRTYKKQIMGSRDSFGKIFDITRKLDTVLPQELFIETIHVMEDMLENHAVAVYSLGKNSEFGRLEIASKEIRSEFPNSIRISKYQAAISELEDGNVWVNRELLPDYPAYMAGIRKNKELVMIVCIKEVRSDQMTLYYMNLFKILCGLVEVALLRALEYQEAAKNMQYVEGTHILKTSYFMERLETFHAMQDEMVASYILLRLEHPGKSKEEADQILQHLIRANDVWGISEEGELYLILSQTDKESLPIVSGRLKKAGIITYETGIAQIARGGGEV